MCLTGSRVDTLGIPKFIIYSGEGLSEKEEKEKEKYGEFGSKSESEKSVPIPFILVLLLLAPHLIGKGFSV